MDDEGYRSKMDEHNAEVRARETGQHDGSAAGARGVQQYHINNPQTTGHSGSGSCFTGRSPVMTRCGWKRIDSIEKGDTVLSFDHGSSRLVERKVIKKLEHSPATVWKLSVSGKDKPIETTANHSFLTKSGWRRTKRLRPGDLLVTENGTMAEVVLVSSTQQEEPVYNLITEKEHNFVVGGTVVHNFTWFKQLRMLWYRLRLSSQRGSSGWWSVDQPFKVAISAHRQQLAEGRP